MAELLISLCVGWLSVVSMAHGQTIKLVTDPWCPFACPVDAEKHGYMIEIAQAVRLGEGGA